MPTDTLHPPPTTHRRLSRLPPAFVSTPSVPAPATSSFARLFPPPLRCLRRHSFPPHLCLRLLRFRLHASPRLSATTPGRCPQVHSVPVDAFVCSSPRVCPATIIRFAQRPYLDPLSSCLQIPRNRENDSIRLEPPLSQRRICWGSRLSLRGRADVSRSLMPRVLFLDDGGVLNDNALRGPEWLRLIGGFMPARLGGTADQWARANSVVFPRV